MKKLLYISFLLMLVLSCKNLESIDISKENGIAEKNDTLPKTGKIFKINNIECYFRLNDTINDAFSIELKEHKTNRVLLSYTDIFYRGSFDVNSTVNFEDVNFDGYKDYYYTSYGSLVMNDLTRFYLFNTETKTFEYSEELTDSHIEDIDSINKKLITSNDYRFGTDSIVHSFDNFGKIKFTEVFSEYEEKIDTIWTPIKAYKKIINGNIIETKRDSIIKK
ncbi:MAG TPA: hypothetical protein VLZ72_00405 [Flavobacterium sp.]|nr:hypothetical protein [Flavobacterium sp.]